MRRVLCLVLGASILAIGSGAIDPAEFECEEAVAHIEACCGARPNVSCGGTCGGTQLSLENATCLRKASCESLESSGACEDPLGVGCR